MTKSKRLSKKLLQEDRDAFAALKAVDGYAPSNDAFQMTALDAAAAAMDATQTDEVQKQAAADAARDDAADSEWAFHQVILGAKDQIKAQFGADSNEYAALGMKKKSEYRTGGARKPTQAA